jgi:hypothetical protein
MMAITPLNGPTSETAPSEEDTSGFGEHSAGSAYACPTCRKGERKATALSDRDSRHVA